MDYRLLVVPVAGFLYWKRYQILQNCFSTYAKAKIAWESYFPKSTTHELIKIEYYDCDHTTDPIDLTNQLGYELENNGHISWQQVFNEIKTTHGEARIQIIYKIGNQQYRCTFTYADHLSNPIKFPMYQEEEIIRHQKSGKFKNGILSATVGDTEVTDLVQQHHGPLQDFHDGVGSKVRPRWIMKDDTKELELIDSMANIHSIKHNDTHIEIKEE